MTSNFPRNSESFHSHLVSQFLLYPPGIIFLESKKIDNVSHSFFWDSQFKSSVFLFDSVIFSNYIFSPFLMRPICCSHWPPWSCLITQTCLSHFLLKLPYPASNCAYFNTLIPIHCLHMTIYVDGRNFLHSQKLSNSTVFEPHNLTAFHFDWHWTKVLDSCGFKIYVVWRGDIMWLHRTTFMQFSLL
jgi:uncharacterized protein with PQ loop repeat